MGSKEIFKFMDHSIKDSERSNLFKKFNLNPIQNKEYPLKKRNR